MDIDNYNEMFMPRKSRKKDFLKVEERHLEEIFKLTNNGQKKECYLEIGFRFDDCIPLKKAAEQMGYLVRDVGGHGYEGFPLRYHLIKNSGEKNEI